jgi:hypothetical protein
MLKWNRGWGEEDLLYTVARIRAQDEDFCATLRQAIEAGMESCPIGVITEPGTKRPIPNYRRPE